MKQQVIAVSLLAAAAVAPTAFGATEADVEKSFFPYKSGVPASPGLKPGLVIKKDNADQFKDVMDAALYQFIKDGWYEVTVAATTSLDLNKNYVEATKKNLNKVKLGAKPGEITGFVAGRPFPEEPDAKDPRAGEKLAWNYKYGINWGDNAAISPFYWKFRDMNTGKIERTIKFHFHFLNYKHRIANNPIPEITPNPSQLFRGIYVTVEEPLDIKYTQLLIHRFEDDLLRDDAYLYLGFQRRVRRLASGQVTDAFLGTDLMIEDFEGYNGRISDMNWTYKGTTNMLMPYYNHNELKLADEHKEADGYQFVAFGGKAGCFPNITWQLRKVYVLESKPVEPGHPIGKRVHYLDAQTATLNRTLIYDRKGELWKSFIIGKAHPDYHLPKNKGSGISIDDSFSMVDVQSKHCTTGQFKGQIDPAMNPPSLFTVQNMRGGT
ncbi:MAG: DUF1329 domain-containing protein [Betaproteobacteria bacterium]|nr:DUF1329 domain-containing protein [Betaproteobacteria bacterium]